MNIAIIFAGGVGKRMQTREKPKQFLNIYDKPIIIHTIEHFQKNEEIDKIVVVCLADWIDYLKALISEYDLNKVCKIVPGGESGQLSIYNGLKAARNLSDADDTIVLIHDGVRPLISSALISKNICDVKKYRSSITTAPVKETIVKIAPSGEIEIVPDRDSTRIARAPQCFYLNDIYRAHEMALADSLTGFVDSCSMMSHYGYELHATEGPNENIKITTLEDYYTMRAVLQVKEDRQLYWPE